MEYQSEENIRINGIRLPHEFDLLYDIKYMYEVEMIANNESIASEATPEKLKVLFIKLNMDIPSCLQSIPIHKSITALIKSLKDMVAVQCNDGNWNYNAYMHGMANGMIFSLALLEGKPPEYLDAPKIWLADTPNNKKPTPTLGNTNE